jgi:hypothetical protein
MDVPKLRRENLEFRAKLLRRAADEPDFQIYLRELFHRDVIFAFNTFFWTLDVRKRPHHNLPFITYPFQDDTLLDLSSAIATGTDRAIEKSRDMGVSWMVILTFLHQWLSPKGGGDFLLGSRIEDYVDKKGDMRTLFAKLRYAFYRLPKWLWPKGFNPRKHDNYMKFVNPDTGATVTGESNNPNFSTGGRYAGILFDEFAKWESTDESAWTAAGDASPCRIAVSTPFGVGGKYFKLVTDGLTKKISLHWSLHPEKALGISCVWPPPNEEDKVLLEDLWKPQEKLVSPWYVRECERRTPTEIAQELDMNYLGAGNPVFEGKAGEALQFQMSFPDEPIAIYPIDIASCSVVSSAAVPSRALEEQAGAGHFLLLYEEPFPDVSAGTGGGGLGYGDSFPDNLYTIGVDVVEGLEDGDFAVITVFNRLTRNVAAVYWGRIDEVLLARCVKAVSDFFSSSDLLTSLPMVGIETNGPGLATFDKCIDLDMTNLFLMPRYDTVNGGVSYRKGWNTNTSSKNELIAAIRSWLLAREGRLNSHRLLGELFSFVRNKNGKAGAKSGCHDDMVMSLGIALAIDELLGEIDYPKKKYEHPKDGSIFAVKDREALKISEPITIAARIEADALAKQNFAANFTDDFF